MLRTAHPHERESELNLVPYLDIMVNLVMFMLMTMTGFITFQSVNVSMQDVGSPNPAPGRKPQETHLSVSIAPVGFYVAVDDAMLPGAAPGPTIPLKPGGEYDYAALTQKTEDIKRQRPDASRVFLEADKPIHYDIIIHTMDATHGDPSHPLFPDVAFAATL